MSSPRNPMRTLALLALGALLSTNVSTALGVDEEERAARPRTSPREHTESALRSLSAALIMWSTERDGVLPTAEEGLAALLVPGPYGPLVHESALRDGWGQAIAYTRIGESSFTLRSLGLDGSSGTSDDFFVDTEGELRAPAVDAGDAVPARPPALLVHGVRDELRVRLAPGDTVRELRPGPVPGSVIYVLRRADEYVVGFDEKQIDGLDLSFGGVVVGDVAGAALVHAARDGRRVLVTPAGEVAPEHELVTHVRFLRGSTDFAYRQVVDPIESFWTIHSASGAETDSPAFGPSGELLAYRKRVDDGWLLHDGQRDHGPHPWISPPRVLDLADGPQLCYRFWDGENTTIVCGEERRVGRWIGDPIVSPDGEHIAIPVTSGGAPRRPFEGLRGDNEFTGADHWYVVDWRYGSFAYPTITDLVFAPRGASWAFRAQDADGRWHAVADGPDAGGVCSTPAAHVGALLFDLDGGHVSYSAIRDGAPASAVLGIAEQTQQESEGRIHAQVAGAAGSFASTLSYAGADDDLYLCLTRPGRNRQLLGTFSEVRLHGFAPTSHRAVAAVEAAGDWRIFAGFLDDEVFDWVSEPVLLDDGTVVFCARDDGRYYVKCIQGQATAFETYGPYDALGEPVGFGSRLAVSVNTGGEAVGSPYGFPAWTGGETRWLVLGPRGWTQFTRASRLLSHASPDGARLALTFEHGGRQSLTCLGQAQAPLGVIEADRIGRSLFLANGALVCAAENDGHASIEHLDGRSSPRFERIDRFALTPDRARPVFRGRIGERQQYMLGARREPLFDGVDEELVWSGDGRTCAYRFGARDEGGYRNLRVASLDGAFEHEVEGDRASLPVFAADGRSVRCVVQRADGLYEVRIAVPSRPGAR